MIPEITAAGKSVATALEVVEKELANVKVKTAEWVQLNGARMVLAIALNHCRSAFRHTEKYTTLRDRANDKTKKGG